MAPAHNKEQALYVSGHLKTGRIMAKDEDVCLHCGLVRRALPDRRVGYATFLDRCGPGGMNACCSK